MSNGDRDQAWYDALTGRHDDASQDAREGKALRNVLLAEDQRTARQGSEGKLDELLGRLEAEGLVEAEFRPRRQPRWYALAASLALAALVVPVVIQLGQAPQPPMIEIPRGAVEPVVVASANPESAAAELAAELRQLGAEVESYIYEDRWIVDAQVATLPQRRLRKALKKFNVAVPEDGRVLLAFSLETPDEK